MTPAARLQAAAEILDEVIVATCDDGPPADTIVTRYFKQRRYAGSKDRRAVRELVFRAVRRSAEPPASGRAAIVGLADDEPELSQLFGEARGPEPRQPVELGAAPGVVPVVGDDQRMTLGHRQVGVREPDDVELDRVDPGVDRRLEALQRVPGRDQVGPLVADQSQRAKRAGSRRRRSPTPSRR